jgi:folate-dependent phosphoribosylglycinamide formyltransferase PurN
MSAGIRNDIVMLAGENITSWIVYNRLVQHYGPFTILVEQPLARLPMIRNRIRKLGLVRTLSQVAFVFLVRPFLKRAGRARVRDICMAEGLEVVEPAARHIRRIASVNSPQCREALQELKPSVVVVNGTRIIKRDILGAVPATFLNIHQGITPQYRGAHGAYWALYQNDPGRCGVTIHVVDEGIDTGGIVAQATIAPAASDNFITYAFLQTAAALDGLVEAVGRVLAGNLVTRALEGTSAVWYHPTIFEYLAGRRRGVR